jgi:NAD(P)-dependent dehydrogenase (short-subunit alcohol dehydrogenase family)
MEKFKWVMNVNLFGTANCCKAAGRYMLEKGKGRIVNFSSVRGLQGKAKYGAYAASKGAVNTYTKSLAVEWATKGINVNAIAPIFTLTNINKDTLSDKEVYNWVISRIPKGKLSETGFLVGPVVFLLSKCSEFVTGEILYVDGGWTAG